jgi:hypothetical protein
MAWLAVQKHIWPHWRFHATVGQYGGWCWWGNGQLGGSGPLHGQIGGSKPQLTILAGQYHHIIAEIGTNQLSKTISVFSPNWLCDTLSPAPIFISCPRKRDLFAFSIHLQLDLDQLWNYS